MDHLKFSTYIDSHYKAAQENKPAAGFVTISRQAGAGGITVGEKLAAYLNKRIPQVPWTVFDKNLVHEVIRDHNLSARMLPFLKEGSIPEIQDTVEDLLRLHPAYTVLVRRTNQTILRLAHLGHTIIVGRGAPVITKDVADGVHVRLIGSLKNRRHHIKEYYQLTDNEAKDFIKKEDQGRAEYLKKYFDKSIDDPLLYDVVINTDNVPYDDAAVLIGGLVMAKINSQNKKLEKVV
jgi:cytidylate kinase